MDSVSIAKEIYKHCPIVQKYVNKVMDLRFDPNTQDIIIISDIGYGTHISHIFGISFNYYFSITGFDKLVISDGDIQWGNYNIVAKYLNKHKKSKNRGQASLVIFEYLVREAKNFEKMNNSFMEIKKESIIASHCNKLMPIMDGCGLTQDYKDILNSSIGK